MKKYAVIVYYTFDIGSEVYLFDTYEQACEYLTSMWNYCFNFELKMNILIKRKVIAKKIMQNSSGMILIREFLKWQM